MSQISGRIVRLTAVTARTPVLISAAATVAAARVISWELGRAARSPLTPEARRLHRQYRELAARPRHAPAAQPAWTQMTQPLHDEPRQAA